MWDWIVLLIEAGAVAGCVYLVYATVLVSRTLRNVPVTARAHPSVTILKPLHGDEPLLDKNLRSFFQQAYEGPVQIVMGVDRPDDGALATARRLAETAPPHVEADIVVRARGSAANPKVGNLINMMDAARNEIIVLADSDVRVAPDYLERLVAELEAEEIGAVTCLYAGYGATNIWSRLSAAAIDTHFLPSVVFGMAVGLASPCFGSTIALRRHTLDAIGGFPRFADCLADDYAIGAAVRATGKRVAIGSMVVTHVCAESTFSAMLRHELRWARTVRSIDPVGFAGSALTHPFALALVAMALGGGRGAAGIAVVALLCRLMLWVRLDRTLGRPASAYWLIPLRSALSFFVFVAAFCGRRVDWQGNRYDVDEDGSLIPARRWTP